MKVYELLGKAIASLQYDDRDLSVKNLLNASLKKIESQIISTNSLDETVELKKLHKDINELSYSIHRLNEKELDKDIEEFFKNKSLIRFDSLGRPVYLEK
jgi:hypothetical protein